MDRNHEARLKREGKVTQATVDEENQFMQIVESEVDRNIAAEKEIAVKNARWKQDEMQRMEMDLNPSALNHAAKSSVAVSPHAASNQNNERSCCYFFSSLFRRNLNREGIQFNIDHLLMIIIRHSNYYEVFGFGTKPGNNAILSFYLNHIDILKKFMLYFADQGKGLIQQSSKNLLHVDGYSVKGMKDFVKNNNENNYSNFTPKKFSFNTRFGKMFLRFSIHDN